MAFMFTARQIRALSMHISAFLVLLSDIASGSIYLLPDMIRSLGLGQGRSRMVGPVLW